MVHVSVKNNRFLLYARNNEAISYAVVNQLLPTLLNVMFGPRAVKIVIKDIINAELPRENMLRRVQSHWVHAQVENNHLILDIGLENSNGSKFFIIEVKRYSLLRTNTSGALPLLHEVDSFWCIGEARDRCIVEYVLWYPSLSLKISC
jgi:hypothetical protein